MVFRTVFYIASDYGLINACLCILCHLISGVSNDVRTITKCLLL